MLTTERTEKDIEIARELLEEFKNQPRCGFVFDLTPRDETRVMFALLELKELGMRMAA